MMQRLIKFSLILIIALSTGCSNLNKATDLITNPSAKERYQRDFEISDELFQIWENQEQLAINDSVKIELPYLIAGHFKPRSFHIFSYNLNLKVGEKLDVAVETDTLPSMVFIELYHRQNDSLSTYEKVANSDYDSYTLSLEIEQSGTFKVIIQPEIEASTPFRIKIKTTPVYRFPVAGGRNTNIQSFWGAIRDGGKRNHEGVDIFAPRGTPVIAVTDGQISSAGVKGLGGKQVWLRDQKRGQSLYYAHLDSIATLGNSHVETGDTLGFVGNTGNARTTSPHLHFGIYKGYRGAIDPLHFVFQLDDPNFEPAGKIPETLNLVTKSTANLRDQPTTRNSQIIGNISAQDTLQFLGKSNEWYHIRTSGNQAAFIHESLVLPL